MKKTKKDITSFSKGMITLGVGSAIGAGVQAHAPAGMPSMTQGFSTAAGFSGMMGTAMMGSNVLRLTKKLKPRKKGKK